MIICMWRKGLIVRICECDEDESSLICWVVTKCGIHADIVCQENGSYCLSIEPLEIKACTLIFFNKIDIPQNMFKFKNIVYNLSEIFIKSLNKNNKSITTMHSTRSLVPNHLTHIFHCSPPKAIAFGGDSFETRPRRYYTRHRTTMPLYHSNDDDAIVVVRYPIRHNRIGATRRALFLSYANGPDCWHTENRWSPRIGVSRRWKAFPNRTE